MDVATLASALMGAQMGQTQTSLAADMMRMNAQSANSVVQLLDAGQQSLASLAPGVGGNLDVRA